MESGSRNSDEEVRHHGRITRRVGASPKGKGSDSERNSGGGEVVPRVIWVTL